MLEVVVSAMLALLVVTVVQNTKVLLELQRFRGTTEGLLQRHDAELQKLQSKSCACDAARVVRSANG